MTEDLRQPRASVSGEVKSGQYSPRPLRKAVIPKPDGGVRELNIPILADRIVQTAVPIMFEPHLDWHMSEASWAYQR